jgi:hypothetical protein
MPERRLDITLIALMLACLGVRHLAAQAGKPSRPPAPFEDAGACPFEGCVYDDGWVANRSVSVRVERRRDAPVAFRLKRHDKVTALTGIVMTVKPGRVVLHAPDTIYQNGVPIVVIPAGETFYLLTYQGEGFTKIWYRGEVYTDVDVSRFDDDYCRRFRDRCNGKIVEPSTTMWWIQIRNAEGRVGWTNEPDAFDGKDALGR